MAGGPRGPVPKRPDQRRRRNKPKDGQPAVAVVKVPRAAAAPGPPPPAAEWHPLVRELYLSLPESGQARFYEPSDWAFARMTCELLSRQLGAEKINASLISTIMSSLDRLLVAEADRRRARLILERDEPTEDAPSVAIMAKYRKAAGGRKRT